MYEKLNVGEDQNQYVRYASKISNNDLHFLATLEAENGLWNADRVGITNDIGFCQISPYWHSNITNDPNFYNPEWQLNKCYELYKRGTTFYGKERLEKNPDFKTEIYNRFALR